MLPHTVFRAVEPSFCGDILGSAPKHIPQGSSYSISTHDVQKHSLLLGK